MTLKLRPREALILVQHHLSAFGHNPNTSLHNRPLTIYKSVFDGIVTADRIESHFRSVGEVVPQWRYTMFRQSHFHSNTHEVLGIADGRAKLCFGHPDNPNRVIEIVNRGDVILIPAGVAHCLLEDYHSGFEMVGCYPADSKQWDMCYGDVENEKVIAQIKSLPWFGQDPIYGDNITF